jgi:hypothetical protein
VLLNVRYGSQEPALGEAGCIAAGNDDVIQHSDIYQTQSIAQPTRDELVGMGRLCDSARVRVGQDHRGGVLLQGFLDDLAGMNRCTLRVGFS